MYKCCRERPPRRSAKGISLIALIITIILIIILAAIILGVATSTPEKAKLATFISDISEVQQGVETKKATNYMPSADGTFDVNKGFTKITIKKTPYSTAEDGWVVNLDNINIRSSTRGNDYNDVVENSEITFGDGAPDIYVYDSDGIVYYAPGFTDKENTIYSKADVTYAATGEIPRVEAENSSYWTFNSATGTISKYTGPDVQELVIPNYIYGVKVNNIETNEDDWEGIYENSRAILSIVISPGITNIGTHAFYDCSLLRNVSIPNTVTSIGKRAFSGCTDLNNVNLPNSITYIGYEAFCYCPDLVSITLPSSLTSMDGNPFVNSPFLSTIEVASGNSVYKSIDGILFDKTGELLYAYPIGKDAIEYVIPEGVIEIKDSAFYASNLKNITIPSSVRIIEDFAFCMCKELINLDIEDGVQNIGIYAFSSSNKLPIIELPSTVSTLGSMAFNGCTSLAQIIIHKTTGSVTGAKWGAPASTVVTWSP